MGPWAPEAAGRQPTFLEPGGSGGAEPPRPNLSYPLLSYPLLALAVAKAEK